MKVEMEDRGSTSSSAQPKQEEEVSDCLNKFSDIQERCIHALL